jgi:hypothetical protein
MSLNADGFLTYIGADRFEINSKKNGSLLGRAHKAYLKASDRLATKLSVRKIEEAVIHRCVEVGCEKLKSHEGIPYCGACGCGFKAKLAVLRKMACPERRWEGTIAATKE